MSKYNWKSIFKKGKTTNLVQGVDFDCTIKSMMQQVRNKAQSGRYNVTISCVENSVSITCFGKMERVR